jgi:DNA-binding GntR family transcriptional regulator
MASSNAKALIPTSAILGVTHKRDDSNLSNTAVRLRSAMMDMILKGEIQAGSRLDQRQLAKRLDTTTAPLREALSALENEGLLVRQGRLGVFCRVYTVPEIEEMVEIRGVLEGLAAKRATAHISNAEIATLREKAEALIQPIQPGEESAFIEKHVAFHKRIVEISRSPRLMDLLRFHHLIEDVLASIAPRLWGIEPHDHTNLIDALATRAPDVAEQAMRNHIAPTYQKQFVALRTRFGEGPILPDSD